MATTDQALPQDTTTEIVGKPGTQTSEFLTVVVALIADVALGVFHKSVNLTGNSAAYIGLAASAASGLYAVGRSILKGKTHNAIANSLASRYVQIFDHSTGKTTHILDVVDGFLFAVEQDGGPVRVAEQVTTDIKTHNVVDIEELVSKIVSTFKAHEADKEAKAADPVVIPAAPGDAAPSANVRSAPEVDDATPVEQPAPDAPTVVEDPVETPAA